MALPITFVFHGIRPCGCVGPILRRVSRLTRRGEYQGGRLALRKTIDLSFAPSTSEWWLVVALGFQGKALVVHLI